MKILLVEDDQVISHNIATLLEADGYVVTPVGSLAEALETITHNEHDAAIIDRGLPDGDGLTFVHTLRQDGIHLPILVLTALGQKEHTIEGLDQGADDYIVKPFDADVLLARLRAVIRRGITESRAPIIQCGKLSINTNTHEVRWGTDIIHFSPREFALLEYLAVHQNQALTRMELLTHVWDDDIDLFSNTVDVHIRYLRTKLGRAGKMIQTVRGKGYILCST